MKGDLLTLLKAGNSYAADALSSMTDHTASIEGEVAKLLTHQDLGTRELAALVLCKHRVRLSNFSAHIEGICDVLRQPATSASVRQEVTRALETASSSWTPLSSRRLLQGLRSSTRHS